MDRKGEMKTGVIKRVQVGDREVGGRGEKVEKDRGSGRKER